MRLFIKKFSLFVLPIILMSYPLDYAISKFISNQSETSFVADEFSVWNDIFEGKVNSEILIYGSSRAWVQFNTEMMMKAYDVNTYNFGVDGHNFWIQYLRHKVFLKNNKKPKAIIVSVDYTTLDKRDDLYNYAQFFPYMLWDEEMKEYTKTYIGFDDLDYILPLKRYTGEFNIFSKAVNSSFKNKGLKKRRIKGYRGNNKEWNNDFKKAKKQKSGFSSNIDDVTVSLFDSFLVECSNDNINVILVFAPIYKEGLEFIQNYNQLDSIYKALSVKHNLVYLNYTKDSICSDRNYFYNATHLNKKGSDVFTKLMISDVNKNTLLR